MTRFLHYYKVPVVPEEWDDDSIYFVLNGEFAEHWVTDRNGVPKAVGNSEMINAVITERIGNFSGEVLWNSIVDRPTALSAFDNDTDFITMSSVTDEANLRITADGVLQGNIDAEATSRQNEDTTLQSHITTETNARIAADLVLQTNINAKQNALGYTAENIANRGVALGYVPLDVNTKISAIYLPSYMEEVVEYANLAAFPVSGVASIIYVTLDTNRTYRWSGSAYVEISASPGSTDVVTEGVVNFYFKASHAATVLTGQNISIFNNDANFITLSDIPAQKFGVDDITATENRVFDIQNKYFDIYVGDNVGYTGDVTEFWIESGEIYLFAQLADGQSSYFDVGPARFFSEVRKETASADYMLGRVFASAEQLILTYFQQNPDTSWIENSLVINETGVFYKKQSIQYELATLNDIPVNTSDLTNDSDYITDASSANLTNKTGNISQWTNDSGYITDASSANLTNKTGNISQWTNDSGYIPYTGATDDLDLGSHALIALDIISRSSGIALRDTSNNQYGALIADNTTMNLLWYLPTASGRLALTSQLPVPAALTKTNDTNVTLTLGGTPNTALLQNVSITVGWTGTLADARIASASTWNGKQDALGFTPYNSTNPAGYITASALSPYLTTATAASTYQLLDADLTTIAGLTATTDNFIVSVSSAWASRTPAQVRTTLALVIGTNVQAYNANLTTYAAIAPSANVQTLLGAASYAAFKTSLSLNNVENTALSTWIGTTNITTLGTIGTGIWQGTVIADTYISSAATWNAKQAAITTGTTSQYFKGDFSLGTFPTNVSSFTNDSGYATAGSSNNFTNKTGNISQWTNDVGYVTAATAGGVNSLTNSDGTLTISPTSGASVASLNLSHANTWTSLQKYQLTTEQLRLGYDTNNYISFTVSSTGNLTIAATVSSGTPVIRFDNLFNAAGTSLTANQVWGANNAGTAMEGKTISTSTTAVSSDIGVTLSGANAIVINIPNAGSTVRGVVSTGAQTINGLKTFNTGITSTGAITGNSSASAIIANGNVKLNIAGAGLYITEGSNCTMGSSTLVAGTKTISTTKITASSRVWAFRTSGGGTLGDISEDSSVRVAGTSFTIKSYSLGLVNTVASLDTSVFCWIIIEPL